MANTDVGHESFFVASAELCVTSLKLTIVVFSPKHSDSVVLPESVKVRRHAARAAKATAAKKSPSKRKLTASNNKQMGNFKYGIEVPRKWADVVRLDRANGSLEWQLAVEKKMSSLIKHNCFDFKHPGWTPPSDYQYAPLHMVYDVKVCGRKKARLVCNGSRVDPKGLSTSCLLYTSDAADE